MNANLKADPIQEQIEQLINQMVPPGTGAASMSAQSLQAFLRQGLSQLVQGACPKERHFFLEDHPSDRANGYAPPRVLNIGTQPVDLHMPRTREGFYPSFLPKHQRVVPES